MMINYDEKLISINDKNSIKKLKIEFEYFKNNKERNDYSKV